MGERVYVNGTPIGGVYLEKLDVERVCDRLFYSESVSYHARGCIRETTGSLPN